MAISITWIPRVIFVPQADLLMISATEYELDIVAFHITLRDLEAATQGAPYPTTHVHEPSTVQSGITYAPRVTIVAGYTVTFEDGAYVVTTTGANDNILDVVNHNQVSVRSANSAGKTVPGFDAAAEARLARVEKILRNKAVTNPATSKLELADDNGDPFMEAPITEDAAGLVPWTGGAVIERKGRLEDVP